MNNTNNSNKNKDDVSSPEQTKIVVKPKNKSKHRIMYFEWTIRLIREMFCLQINTIVSKLKIVLVAVSKKSCNLKNLQFQIRKSGSFLKKKTKPKKNVFLLEAILFFFFSNALYPSSVSKIRNTSYKIKYHHKKYTLSRDFTHTLLKREYAYFSSG